MDKQCEMFGKRLLFAIRENGLRQKDFLIELNELLKENGLKGIRKNALSAYCHGKLFPERVRLGFMAQALCVSASWLSSFDVYDLGVANQPLGDSPKRNREAV